MNSKLCLEMMFKLWNDEWHYEIGPDSEGLGIIEIRYYEQNETKYVSRMSFSREEAGKVGEALIRLSEENNEN